MFLSAKATIGRLFLCPDVPQRHRASIAQEPPGNIGTAKEITAKEKP